MVIYYFSQNVTDAHKTLHKRKLAFVYNKSFKMELYIAYA